MTYRCPWCWKKMSTCTETVTLHPRQEWPSEQTYVVLTCPKHGEMLRIDPSELERMEANGFVYRTEDYNDGGIRRR